MHQDRHLPNAFMAAIALATVLFSGTALAQVAPKTWANLYAQAQGAFNKLKAAEAIELLTQSTKVFPKDDTKLQAMIKTYDLRASAYELHAKPSLALEDGKRVLDLLNKRDGGRENDGWIRPTMRVARFCDLAQHRHEAIRYYAAAYRLSEQQKKNRLSLSLEILHLRAQVQKRVGDWAGMKDTLTLYIKRLEEKSGPENPDLVGPLKSMARCQRNIRDFAGALLSLERWIKIYEAARGKDSPSTATGLRAIVECDIALKKFPEAEKACDRWQRVLERVTKKHPEIVYVCQLRAQIDRLQKRYAEEAAHHLESASRMAALPKPDLTAIGEFNRLLAVCYRKQGKNEKAKESIDACMKIFKKKLRPTDPQRLMARLERGNIAEALQNLQGAKLDFTAVLTAWRKIAGDDHPVLQSPLEGLERLARIRGNTERVQELQSWLARIRAKMK